MLDAGIQKYGMGILFGLYDWEYEVLSLLRHAQWLEEVYGVPPRVFGIPRLKKARGAPMEGPLYRVTNKLYRLAVAVYRLVFPTTHTYMNTREDLDLILDLLKAGGTDVNSEASTVPGGYTRQFMNGEQFFHYSYSSEEIFDILRQNSFDPCFK